MDRMPDRQVEDVGRSHLMRTRMNRAARPVGDEILRISCMAIIQFHCCKSSEGVTKTGQDASRVGGLLFEIVLVDIAGGEEAKDVQAQTRFGIALILRL